MGAVLILGFPGLPRAEPKWFAGTPKEALQLADQTRRGLVLYFETDQSGECQRMNKETWPKMDGEQAGQKFVWMKLNPNDIEHEIPEILRPVARPFDKNHDSFIDAKDKE